MTRASETSRRGLTVARKTDRVVQSKSDGLVLSVPAEALEQLAERVAELLRERERAAEPSPGSAWFDVADAAVYMRCKPQRVYDLVSSGRLRVAKDGARSLFRREWLDAYLLGEEAA